MMTRIQPFCNCLGRQSADSRLKRTRDLLASRNEALRADADKRKLIQKVNSIVEDERKSIAIEIHDELKAIQARLRALVERIVKEVYAETVVIGWENVEDADSNPMDFTVPNCVKLFEDLPDLFKEGKGVVAQGKLQDGVFVAKEVLAKHDENYMPPEAADALKKAAIANAGAASNVNPEPK